MEEDTVEEVVLELTAVLKVVVVTKDADLVFQ